jgi:hypothetical protein
VAVTRTSAHVLLWVWSILACSTLSVLGVQAFGMDNALGFYFFLFVFPVLLSIVVARLLAVSRNEAAFAAVGALAASMVPWMVLAIAFVRNDHS